MINQSMISQLTRTELSTRVEARQKLESQFTENQGVQKEFSKLEDDANIYKLVGPVLLKQDTTEAKSTVDSRLEYIGGEMWVFSILLAIFYADVVTSKRVEENIKSLQQQSEGKRMEVSPLISFSAKGTLS
jgi:prefoldin beta subunit